LQSELWRWFITAMVVMLIAESLLAMPDELKPAAKPIRERELVSV
jgi:uncharacterized membrane protein YadS